jgi:hypothetical protein
VFGLQHCWLTTVGWTLFSDNFWLYMSTLFGELSAGLSSVRTTVTCTKPGAFSTILSQRDRQRHEWTIRNNRNLAKNSSVFCFTIHYAGCLTTGPYPILNRVLHTERSCASLSLSSIFYFPWGYLVAAYVFFFVFLSLIFFYCVFLSITCFRRQFLRKLW